MREPKDAKFAKFAFPYPPREAFVSIKEYQEAVKTIDVSRETFSHPNTTDKQRLDLIGIETICARIESGESYNEISRSIGISHAALANWLNNEQNADRSARAREASAEAWLDRGLDVAGSALPRNGNIDPSAARAYAQECARRAAIRNPKYRDSQKQELVGAGDKPLFNPADLRGLSQDDLATVIKILDKGK